MIRRLLSILAYHTRDERMERVQQAREARAEQLGLLRRNPRDRWG